MRGAKFGCGQCMACRISRRRVWTHRIMLEALCHADCSFATLTYSDDWLPDGGSVVPRDLQLFIKRLRKNSGVVGLRYFGVGEYGDLSERPHYHLALFGIPVLAEKLVDKSWGRGHVMLGDLTYQSAAYIAGYVTKKLTRADDVRLNGRHPEFARMSLRPGIGGHAVTQVSAEMRGSAGQVAIANAGDVPAVLRHGGSSYPLGRYLRARMRRHLNVVPDNYLDAAEQSEKLRSLYLAYKASKKKKGSFAEYRRREEAQKILNLETRSKIRKGRQL